MNTVPQTSPHTYTNADIKNNKDGLYVAMRIFDKNLFGKEVVIGKSMASRKRRDIGSMYIYMHIYIYIVAISNVYTLCIN